MLCPEVWNFPYPKNNVNIQSGVLDNKAEHLLRNIIVKHTFNETLSIIIPDEKCVPEKISELIKSSDYYIVKNFKLPHLLRIDFIEGFVKRGKLTALNIIDFNDTDDIFAITPKGILILSINKDLYQSIGLQGRPHSTSIKKKDRYDLSLKATVTWLCKLGRNLMPVITWVARLEAQKASDVLRRNIDLIHKLFTYNIPCYLYDKLATVIFIKIPNLIESVKRALKLHSSMGEFLSQVNVAVSLSEVLISPHLHHLNFEDMPKMMRHLFYMKLKYFTGLYYLNLSTLSGGWKTEDMEPIVLNGIVSMKNLHTLILTYDCTDNILKALETACPRIQVLDISSSKMIGNNSIKYLLELHHLRSVQLYRTSITIEGYIRLLTKMPKLEDIGRYDAIGTCLEYIDIAYQELEETPILKLKSFTSRYVVTKHLKLLAELCPDIELVSIFHNTLLNNLMALVPINKLCDLRLLSCNFYQDHVRDVLEVKGCNLTTLHLEHVDQIDINALMSISQYCPDLKILTIYNCEMDDNPLRYFKKTIPPFMNLQRLTIAASCTQEHLEFLMMNCLKIKFIHIGTMAPTNDELFDRILANNPMEYLEELRIIYSSGLTIATAYKLVEVCENLAVLNELESWARVQEMELECFKIFLTSKNIDLDIKPRAWKLQISDEED